MDISEILSSLSQEDIKNLQDIASSVMGGVQGDSQTNNAAAQASQTNPLGDIDINAFANIASVMSRLSSSNDPRCRLITSLKPMLSPDRQKRADEAMKILKIIELVPVLRDTGLLKGVL